VFFTFGLSDYFFSALAGAFGTLEARVGFGELLIAGPPTL